MSKMMTFKQAFNGGEVTPELYGRVDDSKWQSGLARCRNFITTPQGPAKNRPGFKFVRAAKYSGVKSRLIPFVFSATQSFVVEMGEGYFRFHTAGATVLDDDGAIYEITNPYAEAELFDIHYVQSNDVVTLVHPNHAPRELRRLGATAWELTTIDFQPELAAPTGVAIAAYIPASAAANVDTYQTWNYKVTAEALDTKNESVPSSNASTTNNLFITGARNTVTWNAVTGAERYNVYKESGGLYGYIGSTTGLSLIDDNISPDMSKTPPQYDDVFLTDGRIASVSVTAGGAGYNTTAGAITAVALVGDMTQFATPVLASMAFSLTDAAGAGATLTVASYSTFMIGPVTMYYPTSVGVTAGGSGYIDPHLVYTNDQGSVDMTTNGFANITKNPLNITLAVTDAGGGSGAVLQATVVAGAITGVAVIEPGSGYFSPVVSVSNALGGAGATFGAPVVDSAGDYPAAVSYFEQRRCFAGTTRRPHNTWMTKSGTEANMSYSLPVRDDDRIAFKLAARELNKINHIVPMSDLMLMTGAAEWRVSAGSSEAISPSNISVRPQSYVGSSNVQPAIINNTAIFAAARGGHVHESAYNWQANGFVTSDLTLRATHLFDDYDILDMAYSKAPSPVVWMVSSSGYLLGLTYIPEQEVAAWHWHDTDGVFESVAVVPEDDEDVLYAVIRRTIGTLDMRYVERLQTRKFTDQADAFFVDSGLTYDSTPATTFTGLDHLEGKTVSILADGAVHPQRVVASGSVTLDVAASVVHIGLPITADVQTLPVALALKDGSYGRGHTKNVNQVWLRVYRSSGIFVGPDADNLTEQKQRTTEVYGAPPALKSDELNIVVKPSWNNGGQIYIRQSDPLPLTLVSLTAEVAMGG